MEVTTLKTKETPIVDPKKALIQELKEKFDLGKNYYGQEQREDAAIRCHG